MSEKIGLGPYQSCGNRGSVGRVSVFGLQSVYGVGGDWARVWEGGLMYVCVVSLRILGVKSLHHNDICFIAYICLWQISQIQTSVRDVVAFLTPGGAIPARRYTLLTYVGIKHTVMERHASFRAGPSLITCVNLSHTGHDIQLPACFSIPEVESTCLCFVRICTQVIPFIVVAQIL